MKAISIRQPWAWAILYAGKDVENRSRRSNYRGPVLLHASGSLGVQEHEDAVQAITDMRVAARSPADRRCPVPPRPRPHQRADPLPAVLPETLPLGGLCGIARVVDCTHLPPFMPGDQPGDGFRGWHVTGAWGLKLADARPLPFLPMPGSRTVPFDAEPGIDLALRLPYVPDVVARVAAYRAAWRELGGS